MESAKAPLVYTFYDEVEEIDPATWFSLASVPCHFICPTEWLSKGDKVKVTIQKVTECPASPTTQPAPPLNS